MLGSEGAKTDFKGILQTFVLRPLFAVAAAAVVAAAAAASDVSN